VPRPALGIFGIDPGRRHTGWGGIAAAGNRLGFVACGAVETDERAALVARLVAIHVGLTRIVAEFRPDEAADEATFVNRDAVATLQLGQAHGVALLVPAQVGISVAEYAGSVPIMRHVPVLTTWKG
jgi:crossover junction endodeoxyribonuclease RuvC